MLAFSVPSLPITVLLAAILAVAAYYDLRFRRIPNWVSVAGVALGLAVNAELHPIWPGLRFSLAGMALAFAIYLGLYAIRAMGAGDAKLMAAVGALVGWSDWVGIFIVTAILGGIAAVALSIQRRRLQRTLFNVGYVLSEMKSGRPAYLGNEELDVRSNKGLSLPHGAVIAVGAAVFLVLVQKIAN